MGGADSERADVEQVSVQRIGVLGGTFDPPHLAHLALAVAAREVLRLDRVIFVPAGDPWRKAGRGVSPAAMRLELVRAAVEALPWAEVSDVEVRREGPSYSQETLAELAGEGTALWFILGADALADMPHWHEPQSIVALARLAVARRPGAQGPLVPQALRERVSGIEDRIDVVPMEEIDISATEIRRRLAGGEPTHDLLAPAVRALIDERGWYR
jgi:nicotinate-nucleotide adenylyltransferase